jgi:hypothetical protein
MPLFRKKNKVSYDGEWVKLDSADPARVSKTSLDKPLDNETALDRRGRPKDKKVFRVVTVRGRQEQAWLDSGMWQPTSETIIPEEARAPLTVVYYGTYGSDGMRHDGAPGGAYSSVFDQYAMQGRDLYTRDEARTLKQWDTRKPFPGFDPKLGSKTLDIYSED